MAETVKAVRYKNLDEARQALQEIEAGAADLLSDGEGEPGGLLAVIPEDRLREEQFYRLFNLKKGVLVEVEKISYSGYGPPAEESDYMGFAGEQLAYVLKGCCLPIEISDCPNGARDIHHLEAMVLENQHPLNRDDLAEKLDLAADWDFDHLFDLIFSGEVTAEEIDRLIHRGIQ